MSAFEVSTDHIDVLLTAGLYLPWRCGGDVRWMAANPCAETLVERQLNEGNAGSVGAMLLAENRVSVNSRYCEDEWEQPYIYVPIPGKPLLVIVLKAIACYEYQSCEHPGWEASEARAFCDALRRHVIASLPGYDEAPWAIVGRKVFGGSAAPTLRPNGARFALGRVAATRGAVRLMAELECEPVALLERHQAGDWGDLGPDDIAANNQALEIGERLFSSYGAEGKRLWVITEADRSSTTILLPEEY